LPSASLNQSAVKRLRSIDTKWWWHESALIKEIGLKGTENATARDLLKKVVSEALSVFQS
jgi:uncharacterized membrane protein YhaH (DUF805 family)